MENPPVYDRPIRSIIVAMDETCGIGKNGTIPWRSPVDMRRFRRITMGHPVVMGSNTYRSIPGQILKGRTNIVLSNKLARWEVRVGDDSIIGTMRYDAALLEAAKSPGSDEIFIIGGGMLYREALPTADRLYITVLPGDYKCDVFFPNIFESLADDQAWVVRNAEHVPDDHVFFFYERVSRGHP